MGNTDQLPIKEMSFEQAYAELQETVQILEVGNLSLAESITSYQKGIELAKHCDFQLEHAELSIKRLMPNGDLEDFDEA